MPETCNLQKSGQNWMAFHHLSELLANLAHQSVGLDMHLQQRGSRSIHLRKRDHIQVYRGGQLAKDGICHGLSSVELVGF